MLTNHWMCLSPRCWSWALEERMPQLVGWGLGAGGSLGAKGFVPGCRGGSCALGP